jgi:hypothetical protein
VLAEDSDQGPLDGRRPQQAGPMAGPDRRVNRPGLRRGVTERVSRRDPGEPRVSLGRVHRFSGTLGNPAVCSASWMSLQLEERSRTDAWGQR